MSSPLPKNLADPIAAEGLDNIIPEDILAKAKGLAIFTVIKAGFLFSGRAGSGLVVARLDDGTWSAPSAIGTGGMGFGGQIGAELTDFVIILNTSAAVKSFCAGGNVTLGGNLSVAAGPVGRNAEAAGSVSMRSVAAVYSYSKTRGLFAGSIIVERKDANESFYRHRVSARELLDGSIPPPPQADVLYRALNSKASSYGSRGSGFVYDENLNHHPTGINRAASSSYGGYNSPSSSATGVSSPARTSASSSTAHYNASDYKPDEKLRDVDEVYTPVDVNDDPVPTYSPAASSNMQKTAIANTGFARGSSGSADPFRDSNHYAGSTKPRGPPPLAAKPTIVTALYDFNGEQAADLSFKKGDIITVTKKTDSKNDWWTGRCNGAEGTFPANYTSS
ncbi:hypothetical protein BGZ76_008722 [Entomortierella beljakovae]|nr:hypothetical protein BGZ76_008722 [Entomortierella beljakovae]